VTPSGLLAIDAQQTRALGSRFRSAVDDAIAHEVRLPQYAAMPRYREWLGAERTRGVPIFETALMTTSTVLRSG